MLSTDKKINMVVLLLFLYAVVSLVGGYMGWWTIYNGR